MTPAEYKVNECIAYATAIGIFVFVIGLILYGITNIENVYWWFLALAPMWKIVIAAIVCGFITFVMGMTIVFEIQWAER